MKVVLAFPCQKRYIHSPSMSILPIGLLSLATVLQEAGHEVQIIHLSRFTVKDGVRLILSEEPELVGLCCFTFQRQRTLQLAVKLREKSDVPIVMGGPHSSPLAKEILTHCPAVNGVIVGEGERTIVEVIRHLEAGEDVAGLAGTTWRKGDDIVEGAPVELVENLDELPSVLSAEISMLGVEKLYQRRHLLTSRGCAARCVFCRAPEAWGKVVRRHSIERILWEVDQLREKYGLLHISFRDDTFTDDREWTLSLCAELKNRNVLWDCQSRVTALDLELLKVMRQSGCVQVQLGVESGSDRVLSYLRKPFNVKIAEETINQCRQVGLPFSLYIIVGVPEESRQDVQASEKLVRRVRPASLSVSRLAYYPGTPLSEELPTEEWFKDDRESIFVREDKGAQKAEKRLLALADEIAEQEPFTEEELVSAAELNDWAPTARLALARYLDRNGEGERALDEYEIIVKEHPQFLWARLEMGDLLLEEGYVEDAEEQLSVVVQEVPLWPYALDRLGWAKCFLGEEEIGEELKMRAAQLEPFVDPPPPPGS